MSDSERSDPRATSPMMTFYIPPELEMRAAIGVVTVVHSQLDHILRMTVKSIASVSIPEAMKGTAFQGSKMLRDRIAKLARQRLGEGSALLKLQALLEECRLVTERRNSLVHDIYAATWEGDDPQLLATSGNKRPIPTVSELEELANDIKELTNRLNEERLHGFLKEALDKRPPV